MHDDQACVTVPVYAQPAAQRDRPMRGSSNAVDHASLAGAARGATRCTSAGMIVHACAANGWANDDHERGNGNDGADMRIRLRASPRSCKAEVRYSVSMYAIRSSICSDDSCAVWPCLSPPQP